MNEDRKKELMMKAIDGLASSAEKTELQELMRQDVALADEYKAFTKIKEVTDSIMFRDLPDKYWDGYWANIYNRLERRLGWILLSLGSIILIAMAAYYILIDFFLSRQVPLLVKVGIAIGGLGVIILLVSVVREVLFAHKKERYKEVKL